MKLKTLFFFIGVPMVGLLGLLLSSTLYSGTAFVTRLEQVEGDGEAIVGLQRFSVALDRQMQWTASRLAAMRSATTPVLTVGRRTTADSLRLATDSAFGEFVAGVTVDRARGGDATDEAMLAVVAGMQSLYARMATALDSTSRLASHGRIRDATDQFESAYALREDTLNPLIRQHLRVQQKEMEEAAIVLAAERNTLVQATLGADVRRRIARIPANQQRLADVLDFTRAFHEFLTNLARTTLATTGVEVADRGESRAEDAIEDLIKRYDGEPVPNLVAYAKVIFDHVDIAEDSVETLLSVNRSAAMDLLRRQLAFLDGEPLSRIDSLPDQYLAAFQEDITTISHRARALNMAFVILGVAVMGLAVGAPIVLRRQVIRPITELTRAAEQLARGDFDIRVRFGGIGEVRDLHARFASMAGQLGAVVAEQRDTAIALRASENRYRTQSEQLRHLLASGPAVVFNLSASLTPHITFISDNVEAQLGYAPGQFLDDQMFWASLVHPEDLVQLVPGLSVALEQGSFAADYRVRRSDGEYRWVHGEIRSVVGAEGAPTGLVGWWIDVTDAREAAEAQRVARVAAEVASRAKSDFLANMSHEIRTPMNGVMGMLELALDAELPPEQREYLEVARRSADSLLTVINDVLDFSKIEAGRMELDAAPFRLVEAMEDILGGVALRAHHKGLELALQVEPTLPDTIVGDVGRLRQVVINLVGNAIKFTDRGEVVVNVSAAGGTDEAPPGELTLHVSVKDSGIGIDPAKQLAIFEAFAQADSSTTRQFGGTGLGLAIASRLVDLMQGRIWVESVPGMGSVFHFTARVTLSPVSLPSPESNEVDLSGIPVLVVDDNATNRVILHGMLTRWGMEPTVVDGGPAALALLRGEQAGRARFRLMIVDAQMPGMDGFGLVERVRGDKALGEPAIMMLSSATFHDDVRRCREAGIDLYLTKPVRGAELRTAIVQLLNRSVALTATERRTTTLAAHMATSMRMPVRVLLAEDNSVNRRLALALLERRGAVVTVAFNGREAVEAWAPGRFDVILMDIQMPELDGVEATQLIRSRESDGQHTPIIALTARAMIGDRERFLAAGMDAYISKPLRASDLIETIDRLTVAYPAAVNTGSLKSSQVRLPAIDLAALKDTTGSDDELAQELISLFLADAPQYLTRLRLAAAAGDRSELRESAHALKGAANAIAARAVAALALAVEAAAAADTLEAIPGLVDAVAVQLEALDRALAGLDYGVARATSR
jgi:two-component system sensor histidine kinase/response regulator